MHLEDCYYANFDLLENLLVLHHLFLPRINESLQQFRFMWNNHKLSTERNRIPNQLELMRKDERARPVGEDFDDEEDCDDEDEEEDVPQVVISPLEKILDQEQQLVFDENVPAIGLEEDNLQIMGERFNVALQWLAYCKNV